MSDYYVSIPSNSTPRIQEAHILLGHIICEIVERYLFEKGGCLILPSKTERNHQLATGRS